MFGKGEREAMRRRLDSLEMVVASLSEGHRNLGTRVDVLSERLQHKVDKDELHALRVELMETKSLMRRCLDLAESTNSGLKNMERFLMDTTSAVRGLKEQVRELNEETDAE